MTEETDTCELCGLPIEDVENDAHEEFDGLYHDECCPTCNGADWKAQRDELLAVLRKAQQVIENAVMAGCDDPGTMEYALEHHATLIDIRTTIAKVEEEMR